MQRVTYLFKFFIIAISIALFAGCAATKIAEMAAVTAVNHVSIYEQEVGAKIKAESDYYDNVMNNAASRINRLREDEQPHKLELEAKKFAKQNSGKTADAIAPMIVSLMESSMKSWAKRDADYVQLMAKMQADLEKSQKVLALEKAKIKQLKNKLSALSEARSQKEMLILMVSFAKEVKTKLDELQESSKEASEAAKKTSDAATVKKEKDGG